MPRKQVGMIDSGLLARVDACRRELGQTRRLFVERALEAALGRTGGGVSSEPRKLAVPVSPRTPVATKPPAGPTQAELNMLKQRQANEVRDRARRRKP